MYRRLTVSAVLFRGYVGNSPSFSGLLPCHIAAPNSGTYARYVVAFSMMIPSPRSHVRTRPSRFERIPFCRSCAAMSPVHPLRMRRLF